MLETIPPKPLVMISREYQWSGGTSTGTKGNIATLTRGDLEEEKRRINLSVMQRVVDPVFLP
jgi:hypothetical protein